MPMLLPPVLGFINTGYASPALRNWSNASAVALITTDRATWRSGMCLLQFPPSTYTRKEVVEKVRHIPLATSFRSAYAYDNVLYLVAGQLIEEVTGTPWEQFVQDHVLDVVGMSETQPNISAFDDQPNIATSHIPFGGGIQPLHTFSSQCIGDVT